MIVCLKDMKYKNNLLNIKHVYFLENVVHVSFSTQTMFVMQTTGAK